MIRIIGKTTVMDGLQRHAEAFGHGRKLLRVAAAAFTALLLLLVGNTQQAWPQVQVATSAQNATLILRAAIENQVLVSVLDPRGNPIEGLDKDDFAISEDGKPARILSVEPIMARQDVGLDLVMVVDNSTSMELRDAIDPLLTALDRFIDRLRPIDNVHLIVFDQDNRMNFGGFPLQLNMIASNQPDQIRSFLRQSFSDEGLSNETFLYDAIYAGLQVVKEMPAGKNPFLVIFSDGEEINSLLEEPEVRSAAADVNFTAYSVDYAPRPTPDPFLLSFSEASGGRLWKAASALELLPIFQEVSSAIFQHYLITYRFLGPPQGNLALAPGRLQLEEVTTIDSSPLLNRVFFDNGSAVIPDRYRLFSSPGQTEGFSEGDLKGTMDKYRNLLNVIGRRMVEHPWTQVTLIGCNSLRGGETIALSRQRAEAVAAYLQSIWGIDPGRIRLEARNLPEIPSNNRIPEGQAENQRVEIESPSEEVMATVKSTYVEKMVATEAIRITPQIQIEAGAARWTFFLWGGDNDIIWSQSGEGPIPPTLDISLSPEVLDRIGPYETLTAGFTVTDQAGEALEARSAAAMDVEFIERKERMAQKMGYRVLEKYALILFEFDRAEITGRNQRITEQIIERTWELPDPRVTIVGHTDTIGSDAYNQKLSERRANAAHQRLHLPGRTPMDIPHYGVGEKDPLYDNGLPEGRQLNRTVVITLEYLEKQT